MASDEAHDRLDRSIPCACDRHLHRQERDSSQTWLWTFWLISALRRFRVWRRNCTRVRPLRTAYIRVGENPEVRPPSKGGGWIVDGEGFRRLVDMEIQKAQRLRYCVSLLCIAADRRSPDGEQPAAASLAERVIPLIRSTDVVNCWTTPCLGLMLVDADIASLPSIVDRLTTRLETFLWSAGGACYPQTATHADHLFHQAHHMMTKAQGDGGGRLYLPS